MKLMTYNILESGEGRIDPLAECIRQAGADAVVVQEAGERALVTRLADRLGMEVFVAENPRNRDGSIALLSRFEMVEIVNHAPLDPRLSRCVLSATLRLPGATEAFPDGLLRVVGVYLHSRETLEDEQKRLAELPAVLEVAARFAGRPHVLAGDFNTSSPEQVIDTARLRPAARKRIEGQGNVIPREVIARVLAAGYVDAHAIGRKPEELGTSFTTSHPATRVDFVFVPPGLVRHVKRCEVFAAPIGRFASDHYPVVAEFA